MTPAVERLVRLMLLLPAEYHDPLWEGLEEDCGELSEVMAMRWFVGDAARMWPPAGAGNLARAVLVTFGAAGDATLRIISDAIVGRPGQGPQAGVAWVSQALAAATEVVAWERPLEEILQEAQDHWTVPQQSLDERVITPATLRLGPGGGPASVAQRQASPPRPA